MKNLKIFRKLCFRQNKLDEFVIEWQASRFRSTSEMFKDRLLALIDKIHEFTNVDKEEKNEELIDVLHFVLSLYNTATTKVSGSEVGTAHAQTKKVEFDMATELINLTFVLNNKAQLFKYWEKDNKAFENNAFEIMKILYSMFVYINDYFEEQGLDISEEYEKKRVKNIVRQIDGYVRR